MLKTGTKKSNMLNAMSKKEKLIYFSGGRVTVGAITQVTDTGLQNFYVAKIRGVIVGNKGEYRHKTREAAQQYGKKILAEWKREAEAVTRGESWIDG